jgi:hypothetical protein
MIRIPREMFAPIVMPQMKERNLAARRRIKRMRFIGFGAVATLTGERQIIFIVIAAFAFGLDMLNGMPLRRAYLWTDAVFAITLRSLSDQTA